MTDPSAGRGIVEHIDDRPRWARNLHFCRAPPHGFQAEHPLRRYVSRDKRQPLDVLLPLPSRAGREYEYGAEQLLGQTPILGRAPAAYVGVTEKRRYESPGIIEDLIRRSDVDRNGRIETSLYSLDPALLGPSGQCLSGLLAIYAKRVLNVCGTDEGASVLKDGRQSRPTAGKVDRSYQVIYSNCVKYL